MTTEPRDQRASKADRAFYDDAYDEAQADPTDREPEWTAALRLRDYALALNAAQSQPPAVSDVEAAFRWGNRYASDLEEGADDEELGVEQRQVQATIAVYLRILLDRARITTTPASEREDEGYPGIAHDFETAKARVKVLEDWMRDSLEEHEAAADALPDSHGDIHRALVVRARAALSGEQP